MILIITIYEVVFNQQTLQKLIKKTMDRNDDGNEENQPRLHHAGDARIGELESKVVESLKKHYPRWYSMSEIDLSTILPDLGKVLNTQ